MFAKPETTDDKMPVLKGQQGASEPQNFVARASLSAVAAEDKILEYLKILCSACRTASTRLYAPRLCR